MSTKSNYFSYFSLMWKNTTTWDAPNYKQLLETIPGFPKHSANFIWNNRMLTHISQKQASDTWTGNPRWPKVRKHILTNTTQTPSWMWEAFFQLLLMEGTRQNVDAHRVPQTLYSPSLIVRVLSQSKSSIATVCNTEHSIQNIFLRTQLHQKGWKDGVFCSVGRGSWEHIYKERHSFSYRKRYQKIKNKNK